MKLNLFLLLIFFLSLTSVLSSDRLSNNDNLRYEYDHVNDNQRIRSKREDVTTPLSIDLKLKKSPTKKAFSAGLVKPLTAKEKAMIKSTTHSLVNNITELMNATMNASSNLTSTSSTPTTSTLATSASTPASTTNSSTLDGTSVDNADTNSNTSANNTKVDNHEYYSTVFYPRKEQGSAYWIELKNKPNEKVITHETLSNSHRKAITIELSFSFPFYGHLIRNITIATGGFLYTGGSVHTWLAATQYIAPLMANFDTSLSNDSTVQYYDNGTVFIVQWDKVRLQEDNRSFTFQAQLYSSGQIVFAYNELPIAINKIPDEKHPVKVGISDAYIVERTFFFLRRKTIFEYHRVEFSQDLKNGSAVVFIPKPTCVSLTDCNTCLTANITFTCSWCSKINRCSNGYDRYRQEWITEKCDDRGINKTSECPKPSGGTIKPDSGNKNSNSLDKDAVHHNEALNTVDEQIADKNLSGGGKAGLISVLLIIALAGGIGLWVFYAYKNPQSSSGQVLIKYRPSRWNWNSLETRYTAASIHM